MSKLARVPLTQAVRYRGGAPMTAWMLHRITGLGIVIFVTMHVVGAFFLYAVPDSPTANLAQAVTNIYESLPMQVFVLFCVLYHATNGLRVIVLDMWPSLIHYNREALWVQWAVFLPLFLVPAVLIILRGTIS